MLEPSPAQQTALFVIENLAKRFGVQWLGGPRGSTPISWTGTPSTNLLCLLRQKDIPLSSKAQNIAAQCGSLLELMEKYYLRSVREDSQRALIQWLRGNYPIELITYIPTPQEMLEIQCSGRRYVSLLAGAEDLERQMGRHQGSLAFLLHDLEHADKFFSDPRSFSGQMRFFHRLRDSISHGLFDRFSEEEVFRKDFHYVMSDMNSHPVHLFKYLKAIVLMHHLRQAQLSGSESLPTEIQTELDDFWRRLLHDWGLQESQIESGVRINRPQWETANDVLLIDAFFAEGFYEQKNTFQ